MCMTCVAYLSLIRLKPAPAASVRSVLSRLLRKPLPTINNMSFVEDFILHKYVADGVKQRHLEKKMRSLIELKYNTISDAASELGSTAVIRETFIGFQQYLYSE